MKTIVLVFSLFLGSTMLAVTNGKELAKTVQMPVEITQKAMQNPIKVRYTNYKGETAVRTIIPISFYVGSTEYHKEEQWLVRLWDLDRNAERIYALKEITQWFVE